MDDDVWMARGARRVRRFGVQRVTAYGVGLVAAGMLVASWSVFTVVGLGMGGLGLYLLRGEVWDAATDAAWEQHRYAPGPAGRMNREDEIRELAANTLAVGIDPYEWLDQVDAESVSAAMDVIAAARVIVGNAYIHSATSNIVVWKDEFEKLRAALSRWDDTP